MCWIEINDEPATPIRVVQRRRRVYQTVVSTPSSPAHGADYRLYTPPASPPTSPRPSYTTITRTHRQRRSQPLVPVYIEERWGSARQSVPTYIEYGGRRSSGNLRSQPSVAPPRPKRHLSVLDYQRLRSPLIFLCRGVDETGGPFTQLQNRSISIRSSKKEGRQDRGSGRHRFSMTTLRGYQQPELSKKLYRIIKNENSVIGAYEAAGRERVSIASQLSDWGEASGDESLSDISDKLGVLLSEIGEQEDVFAQGLEEYRGLLKQIRNTESSVQPSRDQRNKISDEIQKLKYKDPTNTKLVTLEQELVRAEAQNLVAEAQLSNVTRQKVKEAFDIHFAAVVERAEKQIILAQHGRRLLNLLDDTPIVPGDAVKPYEQGTLAREILNDAEGDLRSWEPAVVPVSTHANDVGSNLVPKTGESTTAAPGADGVAEGETELSPPRETDNVQTGTTARESVATNVDESATVATA
ncbi:hypothetical protein UA08_03441 [Talaromyces atroroseus]|uniref:Sphingolipid long chain base-responsive protein PIL1 n=1 Tax=Talaromyces atroroseus TaxID=1441469 RepID=A0A225AJB9_TALAT|nr:hypothetical protein UA08_03441 [Talaromyces atroroseus]OKL61572.1 hypothetical protein UA08_03441 [Talaromyces atroroseus]